LADARRETEEARRKRIEARLPGEIKKDEASAAASEAAAAASTALAAERRALLDLKGDKLKAQIAKLTKEARDSADGGTKEERDNFKALLEAWKTKANVELGTLASPEDRAAWLEENPMPEFGAPAPSRSAGAGAGAGADAGGTTVAIGTIATGPNGQKLRWTGASWEPVE
jgi:hypothetical protein